MNNVSLIGRLACDPDSISFETGNKLVNFVLAVDGFKSGGEKQTHYIDCVAWSQTGELILKHFKKGHKIGLTGSIETRSYKDKNDNPRKKVFVNVRSIDFIQDSRKAAGNEKSDRITDEDGNEYEAPPWCG